MRLTVRERLKDWSSKEGHRSSEADWFKHKHTLAKNRVRNVKKWLSEKQTGWHEDQYRKKKALLFRSSYHTRPKSMVLEHTHIYRQHKCVCMYVCVYSARVDLAYMHLAQP